MLFYHFLSILGCRSEFDVGTMHHNFIRYEFWPYLNFLIKQQLKLPLIPKVACNTRLSPQPTQKQVKLISYEKVFKMLENDMYITKIGQAFLGLLRFEVGSGNHQRESLYFRNFLKSSEIRDSFRRK